MKHSNNYFQKGIIVLVVAMLLTIPNMRVYSTVGSYQTLSPAITANTDYKFSHSIEKPNAALFAGNVAVASSVLGIAGAAALAMAIGGDEALLSALAGLFSFCHNDIFTKEMSIVNSGENYTKYDFSKFDN